MSQKQKLIDRFLANPKDFTYQELRQMLQYFGYTCDESGNGSRVCFSNDNGNVIKIHKPHPGNVVKTYVIDAVKQKLKEDGML